MSTLKNSTQLLGFVILCGAFIIPNKATQWVSVYHELLAFLSIITLLVTTRPTAVSSSAILLLTLPLIALAQHLSGLIFFSGDVFIVSCYITTLVVCLIIGKSWAEPEDNRNNTIDKLALTLLSAAVISSLFALSQWLRVRFDIWIIDLKPGDRPYANLGQPNHLSTLLCLGCCCILFLFERRKISPHLAGLLSFLLIFCIALTQSRTAWLCALFMFCLWTCKKTNAHCRLTRYGFLLWLAVFATAIALLPLLNEKLFLAGPSLAARAQAFERWPLWLQLSNAVWDGPLWGYGWNQVEMAQLAMSQHSLSVVRSNYSHNVLLDILIWNGPILGSLIIIAISTWLIMLLIKARSTTEKTLLLALACIITHGMLEYPLAYAYFLFPLGLLIGYIEGLHASRTLISINSIAIMILSICSFAVFCFAWYEYQVVEEDYKLMRFESAKIGELRATSPAPDVILYSQLREYLRYARTEAAPGMTEQQLLWMTNVTERKPELATLCRLSISLKLNNKLERSQYYLAALKGRYGEQGFASCKLTYPTL